MAAYRSALKLLRIPFSLFLMPVFWFGISALRGPLDWPRVLGAFAVLHLLVYPASNGYNSYYDRDEGSIGGLKAPPKVTPELLRLVYLFDALGLAGALLLGWRFAALVLGYALVSKAYSYEGIRLKKYPLWSTAVVVVFQGAYTFLLAQVGAGAGAGPGALFEKTNLLLSLVSSLFLCGSYPLTQIYQHQEDARRGDRTLSLRLGVRGTFVFAALGLLAGAATLALAYWLRGELRALLIFAVATGPVLALFGRWVWLAWPDPTHANHTWTMRMNLVSSVCLSAAFLATLLWGR
ncbi:UbiA family prenyltransferase [Hymenobacter sp. RP-2-7]|uniref:UbiA family prenyltransferase n=1 Tax=Hymenobacter polaris TaxID=2682546 RepID=A0A7Y0ACL5_9BACT|nr:UbiA family prenyltransferase [Hymenobacter polaris]NML64712.1 UbiA family prenyltransferase [Hymenobacter polaris]